MAAATFMTDLVEIATQAAEAAAGIGSIIASFENISLARKYYNLYNSQRNFYYSVFQSGAEYNFATQAYAEPYYSINYASRVATAFDPSTGPLGSSSTDVVGWVTRHAGMYAQTMDSDITELSVDTARVQSDWANYLFRFEELWADVRNDTRWMHRLTAHNVGIKQGTAISAALDRSLLEYQSNITDLSSQLATYGNGIAKYAGYKRGLADTAEDFSRGTSFSRRLPMKIPDKDPTADYNNVRNIA